ncbi:MAG: chemotaxis protein CheD [Candidatus Caenarcaniphilales bacterium]|nr:chemotaxis protein CheD [Candidatus Caenarcaniphilales bacterium]
MGQWFVTKSSSHELVAPSLGSCIALCLYDKSKKIGGMAHVVLPSRILRDIRSSNFHGETYPSAKYADEVIMLILNEMIRQVGHSELSLEAKMAGGSQMFVGAQKRKTLNEVDKKGFPLIGRSNAEVLKKELAKFNIPLLGSDLGGNWGRTVSFRVDTGVVSIRRIGSNDELLL